MSEQANTARKYFNEILAKEYFTAAAQYSNSGGWDAYKKIEAIIRDAEIDITAFFDERGNLKNLKVNGIGPKTKQILERILEEGLEARGVIAREKEKSFEKTPKDRHLYDVAEILPRPPEKNS